MDFNEMTATAAVQSSFADTTDPRLRDIMTSLTRHLHAFVKENRPSREEWGQAIDFLTAVGHHCDATRQEFILLSDVLGVSTLVETINGDHPDGTESTVLGPFHMVASPERTLGDTIDLVGTNRPCLVSGLVTGAGGQPIAGARLDVWQCDEHGYYDVQQPDGQPAGNGRGLFRTDADGRYWFRTTVPSHYAIPTDGPVGRLLQAANRHPYRPAHIHFIVDAPGYRPLTTHVFVAGSQYLDSDAVFAVKASLIADFSESTVPEYGVAPPFRHAQFDFALVESDTAP